MLIRVIYAILQAMADMDLPTIKTMEGKKMLELLCGISGAFRPGVLTALMGVSGAGKTTLMDVLAGRKTGAPRPHSLNAKENLSENSPHRLLVLLAGGIIEGDIRINGHAKAQETFARVSGYCEQTDVHVSCFAGCNAML